MNRNSFWQTTSEQYQSGNPFVIFAMPGESSANALFARASQQQEQINLNAPGFIFSPFQQKARSYFLAEKDCEFQTTDLQQLSLADFRRFKSDSNTASIYESLVASAISEIKNNGLKKIVLSRKEEIKLSNFKLETLLEALFCSYPMAFRYAWYHPETGLWCAASPELLIRLNGIEFQTMALAGTVKAEEMHAVQWTQKEYTEQALVTEAISSVLEPFAESITVNGPFDQTAGELLHLRSDISGRVKQNTDLWTLVKSLHPTPAVCGTPREQALRFIDGYEGYDREFYCGFLGPVNLRKRGSSIYVNLRCMKVEEDKAYIFSGGGITEESDPKKEWVETINKQQTMLKVLQEFL